MHINIEDFTKDFTY